MIIGLTKSLLPGYTDEEWTAKLNETRHECNMNAMPQVDALLAADWKIAFFDMSQDLELWQWKWRRPPRRAGSKGRLFLSTTMAYNAMLREKQDPSIQIQAAGPDDPV